MMSAGLTDKQKLAKSAFIFVLLRLPLLFQRTKLQLFFDIKRVRTKKNAFFSVFYYKYVYIGRCAK